MSQYRDYPEYLASAHWAFTRKKILERDKFQCVSCRKPAEQVHHINYRNLIDVVDSDLMSVCEACHCQIHVAIEKGYVRLNNKGSIEKTLSGLVDMTNKIPLTKNQIKTASTHKIDIPLSKRLDKLSYQKKRLIFGVLKRRVNRSFSELNGLNLTSKKYHAVMNILHNKPSNPFGRNDSPKMIKRKSRSNLRLAFFREHLKYLTPEMHALLFQIQRDEFLSKSDVAKLKGVLNLFHRKYKINNIEKTMPSIVSRIDAGESILSVYESFSPSHKKDHCNSAVSVTESSEPTLSRQSLFNDTGRQSTPSEPQKSESSHSITPYE